MIFLIIGATHSGKTTLAQRFLEKYHYPYLSQDHLKMGLIRSHYTDLTPSDDDQLTDYLWPVTREIVKTAIENNQNLIIEGCYIPFDWKLDFGPEYLKEIRFVGIVLSERYIRGHFAEIREHACEIEKRLDDSYCTPELLVRDNQYFLHGFQDNQLDYLLIEENYEEEMREFDEKLCLET